MTTLQRQEELERLFNKNQLRSRLKNELLSSDVDFVGSLTSDNIPHDFGLDVLVTLLIQKKCHVSVVLGSSHHHYGLDRASQLIEKMVMEGYINLLADNVLESRFNVSQDVQEELDRFQYPLPFVVRPKKVIHNLMTGYFLSTGGSVILKDNHTQDDVHLDHLNRCNEVRLTVNMGTVQNTKNTWKNLSKPKAGETIWDFKKRVKQFEKMG